MCAWIITKDEITKDEEQSRVGHGQWGLAGDGIGHPPMSEFPHSFRLMDEDGEIHFEGRYDSDAVTRLEENEWGALYRAYLWGSNDSGAVILKVKSKEWIPLRFEGADSYPAHYAAHYRDNIVDGWYTPFG